VAPHLHGRGMSIAPFWHYTTPMIARPGVDDAWRWLLLASYIIDRKKRRPESHAANEAS
jgi:hypothetical protein